MSDRPDAAPPLPGAGHDRPTKRSLTLQGHRTSVSLEEAFWQAFRTIAAQRGRSLNALAADLDAARNPAVPLASTIRVFVLESVTAER